MRRRRLSVRTERLRLVSPFRISGYVFEHQDAVVATIEESGLCGRGEASGVYYLGDDLDHMLAEVETHRATIESGIDRIELQQIMPRGGARNAVDCALWELEAAQRGQPVWRLAGIDAPKALVTTFTLGADDPQLMANKARGYDQARAIKIKLTGDVALDLDRVRAVREARRDAWLAVDANQGFSRDGLEWLVEALLDLRISLLEQPLPRGCEADLEGFKSPIPIAADESVLGIADLPGLVGRFDVANIKLDKCGGLTEALLMVAEARRLGLGVMVGNMVGTSLAMAPAFIVGQYCDVVDLDGPAFLVEDRQPAIGYQDGLIHCPDAVWGAPGKAAA
jgi:L-alanine-DL-glutamate epimerase-like enolase superfamily enzyme